MSDDTAVFETFGAGDIAVEFDWVGAARCPMKTVNVLGDEGQVGDLLFELGQGHVSGIWPGVGD
jgi:hypothetical protein